MLHDQASSTAGHASNRGRITGWLFDDIVFERHTGNPPDLPRHAHDTYQIGTTTRDPGEYVCNGRHWLAPPGSMMLFHPGEVHSATPATRLHSDTSRIIFVAPERLCTVASVDDAPVRTLPRFPAPVLSDRRFIHHFTRCYDLVNSRAPRLEKESALLDTLATLVRRFTSGRANAARLPRHRGRMEALRGYIDAHYVDNVGLAELARVAEISPYHLSRLFTHEIGLPPHAYQTQLRVGRAKALLLAGMPVAEVAVEVGFFDQSHFTRHFRRIVGVSPKSYVSKVAGTG